MEKTRIRKVLAEWKGRFTRGERLKIEDINALLAMVQDTPTGVSAVAGDGSATVSFTPASDLYVQHDNARRPEGSTQYRVVANPGGAKAVGTSSPIVVTGLKNGTRYTFTVTDVNSGDPASADSNAVTPGVPSGVPVPQRFTATERERVTNPRNELDDRQDLNADRNPRNDRSTRDQLDDRQERGTNAELERQDRLTTENRQPFQPDR